MIVQIKSKSKVKGLTPIQKLLIATMREIKEQESKDIK